MCKITHFRPNKQINGKLFCYSCYSATVKNLVLEGQKLPLYLYIYKYIYKYKYKFEGVICRKFNCSNCSTVADLSALSGCLLFCVLFLRNNLEVLWNFCTFALSKKKDEICDLPEQQKLSAREAPVSQAKSKTESFRR